MFVAVPRFIAKQVAKMVLNGHLRKWRQSATALPCSPGSDGLNRNQILTELSVRKNPFL
ncbi:hypothetical protein HDG35_006910 [Paraburkholderia sp. JPY681]|uniref:Uncharacterized protein n=1 Tax=Paraburkholderia atlantica TaxID=2654982 RepID=D5WP21_PARAM|nr:hypothetical protein BC1002_6818 [Paraburkholderia atlantica]MBB5510613.1 hypothetical protein [Paraburkholderia atlantica]